MRCPWLRGRDSRVPVPGSPPAPAQSGPCRRRARRHPHSRPCCSGSRHEPVRRQRVHQCCRAGGVMALLVQHGHCRAAPRAAGRAAQRPTIRSAGAPLWGVRIALGCSNSSMRRQQHAHAWVLIGVPGRKHAERTAACSVAQAVRRPVGVLGRPFACPMRPHGPSHAAQGPPMRMRTGRIPTPCPRHPRRALC